jgi:rare lipoprotein A
VGTHLVGLAPKGFLRAAAEMDLLMLNLEHSGEICVLIAG